MKTRSSPAVLKVQNPAVLEETVDDADDRDVVAQPRDLGTQAADAADVEADLHSGLRRGVERFDHRRVARVQLGHDAGLLPLLLPLRLPSMSSMIRSRRPSGAASILRKVCGCELPRDGVEERRFASAPSLRSPEQAGVVYSGAVLLVVVCLCRNGVALDPLGLAPETTMHSLAWVLMPLDPVDHMDARLLEIARPFDVRASLEAGLQLHDRGDVLPRSAARLSAATIGLFRLVR